MFIDFLKQSMIGISAHTNHFVARHMPSMCPFIMVSEFPRSGGNWIRDMLGDCLQLPVPRFSLLPMTFSGLGHSHSALPIEKIPSVYVVRDGRDVFISHFWKAVNGIRFGNNAVKSRILKIHPSLQYIDLEDENHVMKVFYEEWKRRPIGSKEDWGTHINSWLNRNSKALIIIRYEDMRREPEETLNNALQKLTNKELDDYIIEFSIQRNSFIAKTGRLNGDINNTSNRRSGNVGGWKKDLSDELKQSFEIDFGTALREAGYDVT